MNRQYIYLSLAVTILIFTQAIKVSNLAEMVFPDPALDFIGELTSDTNPSNEADQIGSSALSYTQRFAVDTPSGQINQVAPSVVDLDGNGTKEILVGTYNGKIYAWDSSGADWPKQPLFDSGKRIISHLAIADVDDDGDMEIAVGVSQTSKGVKGEVYFLDHMGNILWRNEVDRFGSADELDVTTVAIADIDGDFDFEIIAATSNNLVGTGAPSTTDVNDIYAWHIDGTLVTGWPRADGPSIRGSLAVGDLNSDNVPDVLVGRDHNFIFAYTGQGADVTGWPVQTFVHPVLTTGDKVVHKSSGPVIADLDQDGKNEYIVAGARVPNSSDTRLNSDLMVFQSDGTRATDWQTPAAGNGVLATSPDMKQHPAIADLNNDGKLDIVVTTRDGWIRAYTYNKILLWQHQYNKGAVIYASEPTIGDVDDDGRLEVVFGTYDPDANGTGPVGLWVLEHDGSVKGGDLLALNSSDTAGIRAAPTLTDLENDGTLEIVATTRRDVLLVWNTNMTYHSDRLPWPTARHDERRTGNYETNTLSLRKSTLSGGSDQGERIDYIITLIPNGKLTNQIILTDVIQSGLSYIPNTLAATHGTPNDSASPILRWSGGLTGVNSIIQITYGVTVTEPSRKVISNAVEIGIDSLGNQTREMFIIVNPIRTRLPLILK